MTLEEMRDRLEVFKKEQELHSRMLEKNRVEHPVLHYIAMTVASVVAFLSPSTWIYRWKMRQFYKTISKIDKHLDSLRKP